MTAGTREQVVFLRGWRITGCNVGITSLISATGALSMEQDETEGPVK